MRLKIYLISLFCLCCIGQIKGQNKHSTQANQSEFERDKSELQILKSRAISFQNFFFGMNRRRTEYYRHKFLIDFAREIEQGEEKCKRYKNQTRVYKRLVRRLKKQKKIYEQLKEYKFSFKDGDIPRARAKKKQIEQFIKLVEEDLRIR